MCWRGGRKQGLSGVEKWGHRWKKAAYLAGFTEHLLRIRRVGSIYEVVRGFVKGARDALKPSMLLQLAS